MQDSRLDGGFCRPSLALRFFAAKNYRTKFKGNISEWLDDYMESVLLREPEFDFQGEKSAFTRLFKFLAECFGPHAFVKYRDGAPIGGVAPAYFEAVSVGCMLNIETLETMNPAKARRILAQTVESSAFRDVTGPGANSKVKFEKRIEIVSAAFKE